MTWRRAASLAAVVAVLLGAATGASHIGHSSTNTCVGTWWVVVGHPQDRAAVATENSRAVDTVTATCSGSVAAPTGGGYLAIVRFKTQAEAEDYQQQLVAAGFAKAWDFDPYVAQAPRSAPTP